MNFANMFTPQDAGYRSRVLHMRNVYLRTKELQKSTTKNLAALLNVPAPVTTDAMDFISSNGFDYIKVFQEATDETNKLLLGILEKALSVDQNNLVLARVLDAFYVISETASLLPDGGEFRPTCMKMMIAFDQVIKDLQAQK